MSSALFLRMIGGAIGTYVSGKIYQYIYYNPQPLVASSTSYPLDFPTSKIIEAKSFEEILNIQLQEYINKRDKYNYEYDNEHGNTFELTNVNDVKNIIS